MASLLTDMTDRAGDKGLEASVGSEKPFEMFARINKEVYCQDVSRSARARNCYSLSQSAQFVHWKICRPRETAA